MGDITLYVKQKNQLCLLFSHNSVRWLYIAAEIIGYRYLYFTNITTLNEWNINLRDCYVS